MVKEESTQYEGTISCHFGVNTDPVEEPVKELESKETMTTPKYYRNIPSQTEDLQPQTSGPPSPNEGPSCSETASQTDGGRFESLLEHNQIQKALSHGF